MANAGRLQYDIDSGGRTKGMSLNHYELQDLEDMIHSGSLVDLQSIGCWLTWTNGIVSYKLDRVMGNAH